MWACTNTSYSAGSEASNLQGILSWVSTNSPWTWKWLFRQPLNDTILMCKCECLTERDFLAPVIFGRVLKREWWMRGIFSLHALSPKPLWMLWLVHPELRTDVEEECILVCASSQLQCAWCVWVSARACVVSRRTENSLERISQTHNGCQDPKTRSPIETIIIRSLVTCRPDVVSIQSHCYK